MNKTVKYILIAVAIVAALALIIFGVKYFIDRSSPSPAPTPAPGSPTNTIVDILGGLFAGGFFGNLFGGGKKCDPNNNCYQKNGEYNLQCCQTSQGGQTFKCDCNNPGYTTTGEYKESCKEGRVNFIIDCGF